MPSPPYTSKNPLCSLQLCAGLIGLLSIEPLARAETPGKTPEPTMQSTVVEPGAEPPEEYTWLDEAEEEVGRRADELARKLDNFYGEPVDDFSRAHSRLRLQVGATYDDIDDLEYRFKIRGKVDLPRISKRLSLLFEGEEGNPFANQNLDEDDDDRAGVQLNLSEGGRHRLDALTNVNSSLDLRAGMRYRYDRALTDQFDARYVQDVAYDTKKKTFTRGRPYLNFLTSETSMLRGLGQWEYGEESSGLEWKTALVWVFKLAEEKAVAPAIYAVGQTDPKLTRHYGFGVRYRTNIYKDFLFMELLPAYVWKKPDEFTDRQGTWAIGVYFEMHFEADEDAPYGGGLRLPGSRRSGAEQPEAVP